MATLYRKKPVVIEAICFLDGDRDYHKTKKWCPALGRISRANSEWGYIISTLEGDMQVSFGDYIIKGVAGEFYPCKPHIFNLTYEAV